MAQAGYTPISLYYSTTAAAVPLAANLAQGELAINIADGKLYYENSSGVVTLLASSTTVTNSFSAGTTGFTPSTATTGAVTLGGTLITSNGGTGLASYTAGDLSYYASGTALTKLAIGTAGQFLTSTGTAPQWSTLSGVAVTTFSAGTTGFTPSSATSGVVTLAGTLATTNGGTGLTSFTSGGVVYASSTSALATGSGLTYNGTSLEVAGNSSINGNGFSFQWVNSGNKIALSGTSGVLDFYTGTSSYTKNMTLDATGNLGLGTSSPTTFVGYTVLEVKGPSEGGRISANYNNSVYMTMFANSNNLGYVGTNSAHPAVFITSGTERMRITSAGLVGIGLSSPNVKLEVADTSDVGIAMSNSSSVTSGNRGTIFMYNSSTSTVGAIRFGAVTDNVGTDIQFYTRPAAGSLAQTMTLNSAGNLGIGTTSPAVRLSFGSQFIGNNGYANAIRLYDDGAVSTSTTSNSYGFGFTQNSLLSYTAGTGGDHAFYGANTERFRITSAGNVGIGTSSPTAAQLVIKGDGATTQIRAQAATNTNQGLSFIYNYSGGYGQINCDEAGVDQKDLWYTALNHKFGRNTSSATMTLDASGNLIVGDTATSVTAEKVSIRNNSGPALILRSTGDPSMRFYNTTDNGSTSCQLNYYSGTAFSIETISAIPMVFLTTNAERARITATGELLVGTTTASTQTGRFEVHSASASTTGMFKTSAGSTTAWACNFWNDSTGGNNLFVEFGTEGTYTARGTITYNRAGGLTVYNTTSDARLKQNIVDAPSALSKIASIQIRSFDWKETGNHVDFGVIAQELNQVAPEAVTEGEDNENSTIKRHWGVDTSVLVPALVKAVQEQQAIIESLKARLDAANL